MAHECVVIIPPGLERLFTCFGSVFTMEGDFVARRQRYKGRGQRATAVHVWEHHGMSRVCVAKALLWWCQPYMEPPTIARRAYASMPVNCDIDISTGPSRISHRRRTGSGIWRQGCVGAVKPQEYVFLLDELGHVSQSDIHLVL